MPASLNHVHANTPMGANLIADGATFRVWAPNAARVHVIGNFNQDQISEENLLNSDTKGHWLGFIPGVKDRDRYVFYVVGASGASRKRDPYARELQTPFPADCIIRTSDFPWHADSFSTPRYEDFVIYQLHVGTFFTPNLPKKGGTFLDVARKVPYFKDLGITAIQLLPIQEFHTTFSLGYNGVDYFSPEMDYAVEDPDLQPYLDSVNLLLTAKNLLPYNFSDLRGEMNQLKALIDLCHIYGIAVIFDVVYNHAGGEFGTESIYFFDMQDPQGGNQNSLYFTDKGHAGGLVFDYGKEDVRNFLINNAKFLFDEYHIDGLRYDQVSVIDHDGAPLGWKFCQELTSALDNKYPEKLNKAEYWNVNPYVILKPPAGAGFDTTLTDGIRISIRDVIYNASIPDGRPLDMHRLAFSLWPQGFSQHWQFVQGPENHDLVYRDRESRIVRLADPSNARSWYARSRARVATAISLTAPGIPMLFMGQEFLEDKQWADDFQGHMNLLLYWHGVENGDKQMLDHIRFISELLNVRKQYKALRSNGFSVIHTSNENRVLAFQRWVEGYGQDVVVVVHLSDFTRYNYQIGFPKGGRWKEVFNSDVYENWVNPNVAGNGGSVNAYRTPRHGLLYSASLVLPANSVLVFASDR